ncbi:MAG: hypothetical protein IT367_18285 [Candidatus Hydrogenedentes bacterium]|nr:hypothetical protein [Candidatus Hydrogenedentota bacterium]
MAHGQTLPHSARFVMHVVSFGVQDLLHIPLFVALDAAGISVNFSLGLAIGASAIVAAVAPMVVWLSHDVDTYWVRPTGFRWLYARLACVLIVAAISGAIYLNISESIVAPALTIALAFLCVLTLIDACLLTINGLRA